MPQITIDITDRLAEMINHYEIPVSRVCQRALAQEIASRLPLLMLTPEARAVLHRAAQEAQKLGHTSINSAHILLGILADPHGIAGQELRRLGVADTLRQRLHSIMAEPTYASSSNTVVDGRGNVLGFLAMTDAGPRIVDASGQPVNIVLDDAGYPVVLGADGRPRPLEPDTADDRPDR